MPSQLVLKVGAFVREGFCQGPGGSTWKNLTKLARIYGNVFCMFVCLFVYLGPGLAGGLGLSRHGSL